MNPNTTVIWSIVLLPLLTALSVVSSGWSAFLSILVLVFGTYLVARYNRERHAARKRGHQLAPPPELPELPAVGFDVRQRRWDLENTPDRKAGLSILIASATPATVGLVYAVRGHAPLSSWQFSVELAIALSLLIFLALDVYLSTLVDWYYTLPRLSGLVMEPPCRSGRNPVWLTVTRTWYIHRWFAMMIFIIMTCVIIGALFGSLAYLAMLHYLGGFDQKSQLVAALTGAFFTLLIGLVFFIVGGVRDSVQRAVLHSLNVSKSLGKVVKFADDPTLYYVVDVAVEGMKLKRVESLSRYGGLPFADKHDRDRVDPKEVDVQGTFTGCSLGCCGVNWYCDHNTYEGRYRG